MGRFKTPAKHVENNALEACSGATTLNGPCALSAQKPPKQ